MSDHTLLIFVTFPHSRLGIVALANTVFPRELASMPRAMANLCRAGRVWLCLPELGSALGVFARFASCDANPLGCGGARRPRLNREMATELIGRLFRRYFPCRRVLFPVERFRIDSLINRLEEN